MQSRNKMREKVFLLYQKVLENVLTKEGFCDIIYERWQKLKMAG